MLESPRHTQADSSDLSDKNLDDIQPTSPGIVPNEGNNGTVNKLTRENLLKRDSLMLLDEEARLTLRNEIQASCEKF